MTVTIVSFLSFFLSAFGNLFAVISAFDWDKNQIGSTQRRLRAAVTKSSRFSG
jgi:hypothetical protein